MIDLEAIKARAEKASPGPWSFKEDNDWELIMPGNNCGDVQMCNTQYYPWTPSRKEDWEFVAHARTDIPALIARVEELEELVDRYRQTARDNAFERDLND